MGFTDFFFVILIVNSTDWYFPRICLWIAFFLFILLFHKLSVSYQGIINQDNGFGFVLSQQDKDEDAIEKYQQATELNPAYADGFNNWGYSLMKLNRHEEAD